MGDIFNEGFEGAGYENADWVEFLGDGSTVDEDNADVARPTGGGTQCLKIQKVSPNFDAAIGRLLPSEYAISYTEFCVLVNATGIGDASSIYLAETTDTDVDTCQRVYLTRDGSDYLFLFFAYIGGALTNIGMSAVISFDTWYKIGLKYDVTNHAYDFQVDNVSLYSGTITETHRAGVKRVYLGDFGTSATLTAYFDLLKIDSSGFPAASTWIPKVIMVM